ncbi:hypothetical protein, partial [Pseudomonas paraeruginosa]|uniref:hypothetical protein n=1 Tax=Pseudomonas paraeruginosa TaxID=2994495 RepID=UPI0034D3DB97
VNVRPKAAVQTTNSETQNADTENVAPYKVSLHLSEENDEQRQGVGSWQTWLNVMANYPS